MILVTGATGRVGRQVVSQLRDRAAPVRAVARDPGSVALPADVGRPEPVTSTVRDVTGTLAHVQRMGGRPRGRLPVTCRPR